MIMQANALRIPLAPQSVHCVVTSPPYLHATILWYNCGMAKKTVRNQKGQFVKGARASRATEFKPGTHWRERKPYWDSEWLRAEYVDKQRSCSEIAEQFGVTPNAIEFWLKKHGIPARSIKETRAVKHWSLRGAQNGMYGMTGSKNPHWLGGCTPERQALYSSPEWARVSIAVWRRDKATCQCCGATGKDTSMHIHHIVSFAVKELRSKASNLVLLCEQCHRFVHSKRNKSGEFIKKEVSG